MRHIHRLFALVIGLAIVLVGCDLLRTPEECEADLDDMRQAVDEAVSSGLSCRFDTDCVLFNPSNNCFGACPVAINVNEMPRVEDSILQADMQYCRGFSEQCGYTTPSCPALQPVCQQGQCMLVDNTGGP